MVLGHSCIINRQGDEETTPSSRADGPSAGTTNTAKERSHEVLEHVVLPAPTLRDMEHVSRNLCENLRSVVVSSSTCDARVEWQ